METSEIIFGRRKLLATGIGLAATALAPFAEGQSRYPVRPVRLVVPFPAGTSPDVIARLWSERFAKATGQTVIVENKPGAGTIIAAQSVSGAVSDGYTLLWTVNNTFSINPFVYRKLPYSLEDFVPITRILSVPFVLLVSAESKIRTLDELVRAAKSNAGTLSYASPGIGTSPHIVMAQLLSAAGITMTHIPYKDYYIHDVIAGRIDAAFDASTTSIAQIKGGKVRALGISSVARVEALKDVIPISDTYPGFAGESWHGIFAPKGTPESIVNVIAEVSQGIVGAPDFRFVLEGYGLVPVGGTSSAFRHFLVEDAKRWGAIIRTHNITAE